MTLGEKIAKQRKELNYTQEQLADILGVSRQSISKWESDIAYPETDKLIKMGKLFECSMDYLLNDDITETGKILTLNGFHFFCHLLCPAEIEVIKRVPKSRALSYKVEPSAKHFFARLTYLLISRKTIGDKSGFAAADRTNLFSEQSHCNSFLSPSPQP